MWTSFFIRILLSTIILKLASKDLFFLIECFSFLFLLTAWNLITVIFSSFLKRFTYFLIIICTYLICAPYPFGLLMDKSYPYLTLQNILFYLSITFSILCGIEAISKKDRFLQEINTFFFLYLYIAAFVILNIFLDNYIQNAFVFALYLLLIYYNFILLNNLNFKIKNKNNNYLPKQIIFSLGIILFSILYARLNFNDKSYLSGLIPSLLSILVVKIYGRNTSIKNFESNKILKITLPKILPVFLFTSTFYIIYYSFHNHLFF